MGRRAGCGLLERAVEGQTLTISTSIGTTIAADLGSKLVHVKLGFWQRLYFSAAALETWGALDTTHVEQVLPERV